MLASFISLPSPFSLSSVFLPNPRSHIRTIQLGGPGTAVSGGCGRSPDAQRTVSQDQRICSDRIIAAAHNSLKDGLDGLEVCSWCRSSLSQRPLRTRYILPSHVVTRQRLPSAATGTLVPRARMDNKVS